MKLIIFCLLVIQLQFLSPAGAAISNKVIVQGKVKSFNETEVVLVQKKSEFKIPRSAVPKDVKLRAHENITVELETDLREQIIPPESYKAKPSKK